MKKRLPLKGRFSGLLAGLAMALVSSVAVAQDMVPLTVWSDTPRLPTFEAYQEAHEGVDLKVVTVAPENLVAKLQLAMRAKSDMPDAIFMSDVNYGAMLATRRTNYLMDLSDVVPMEIQDGFYPNGNAPCMINGKLMCLRNDLAHMILWYNQPQMDELGMAVPTTWEEFEQLGADLVALDQGYFIGTGVEPFPLISMLMAGGCDLAVPVAGEDDTIRINLGTEKCLRPARMIDNMIANGSLSTYGPFDPAYINAAKEGKLVLTLGPTWFGEYVVKPTYEFAPKTLAAALPPKWSDEDQPLTWSWGGGTYGGWKDSAHPEELIDMLIWVATSDNQQNAVTMPAYKPVSLLWGEKLKTDGYYASDDVFEIELKSADYSHPGYASLRFGPPEAVAKVITPELANGGKLVDHLPALEQELINGAKVAGYTVVQ